MPDIEIRESRPDDLSFIEQLYRAAFPDEDLQPLVRQLLTKEPGILSLVAEAGDATVGHILFTLCEIAGSEDRAALLAPLAVAPEWQRKGIGSALIREGLSRLEREGVVHVYVLGDPAYYGRNGFTPEPAIAPPYPLPAEWREAWQSLGLGSAPSPDHGKIKLPEVWMQPALWGP
ncbi:MAG: N-acetyltransferase [Hoeflea sp.]|uniref:GNAT family N-acetyltransferase n=1 Tax=Hoeflea sp. TaxID=1940281 RepID=UPI001D1FB941|nr:N-acetyltransferase [Hoeflea sp.]MBU4529973.1 N-acetyltransferase [Alphaproteobacteria bacterium]MBU4543200.1 N-acetyltransferase [Alphaproteobacteria bacterium]MBU4550260.1 N-acetyltransferase [Alphaproteobacteria bacterium]MBV1722466.1 N-acetyltransferase [Hoeflea sp.]MBV1761616.1 N-acetyltransferase [Hoeflea sp.]